MWIAKPLQALSPSERSAWVSIGERIVESWRRDPGASDDFPLSQTLVWGEAIQAVGGSAFLIMNAEEGVGGLVHATSSGHFECVNGPVLSWDEPDRIARQLATFAMAVSKLSRDFRSLTLQPRWAAEREETRLQALPIEPYQVSTAATIHLRVAAGERERRAGVSARLRRSLRTAERSGVSCKLETSPEIPMLKDFSRSMQAFARTKGFFVPDERWFVTLSRGVEGGVREALRFWLVEARHGSDCRTRLLICSDGRVAHYLFGCEERGKGTRSSISTSAMAHFRVLEECAAQGILTYDLNGFTDPEDSSHPYSAVSRFKAQFQGCRVDYCSPEFRISL